MRAALGFSERTDHAAKKRPKSARSLSDEPHKQQIRRVWENNHRASGAHRIWKQLGRDGYPIGRSTVERLMALGSPPPRSFGLGGITTWVLAG